MGGLFILIAVFLLWQALIRRKSRKETLFNWKEAAEGIAQKAMQWLN